jgi:hypothetical protein
MLSLTSEEIAGTYRMHAHRIDPGCSNRQEDGEIK